jgi:hypothetical protein
MKPVLKIGKYYHAPASWGEIKDRPMRLEWNPQGSPYWTVVRDGEYHWWAAEPTEEAFAFEVQRDLLVGALRRFWSAFLGKK